MLEVLQTRYRVRPSVAIMRIPEGELERLSVFMSSTRQSRSFLMKPTMVEVLVRLDGSRAAGDVAREFAPNVPEVELKRFLLALVSARLIEDATFAERWADSPLRRMVNFLGDFYPYVELDDAVRKLRCATVVIMGVGGVGSWVALEVAKLGIGRLVLVDTDEVALSNLNRSRFAVRDVGVRKVEAVRRQVLWGNPSAEVIGLERRVAGVADAEEALAVARKGAVGEVVMVNCADEPSVDVTNRWLNSACQPAGVPLVIAGGYNLHLNLMGPTLIPERGPCLDCIVERLDNDNRSAVPDGFGSIQRLVREVRKLGSLGPLASFIASFAALEVWRCVLRGERMQPALVGRRAEYDVLKDKFEFTTFDSRPDCRFCSGFTSTTGSVTDR
jgi:molybdopterin-synthase adenylyltransferase